MLSASAACVVSSPCAAAVVAAAVVAAAVAAAVVAAAVVAAVVPEAPFPPQPVIADAANTIAIVAAKTCFFIKYPPVFDCIDNLPVTNIFLNAHQPFTEPIMTPFTKYFWINGYTQRIGSVETTITL